MNRTLVRTIGRRLPAEFFRNGKDAQLLATSNSGNAKTSSARKCHEKGDRSLLAVRRPRYDANRLAQRGTTGPALRALRSNRETKGSRDRDGSTAVRWLGPTHVPRSKCNNGVRGLRGRDRLAEPAHVLWPERYDGMWRLYSGGCLQTVARLTVRLRPVRKSSIKTPHVVGWRKVRVHRRYCARCKKLCIKSRRFCLGCEGDGMICEACIGSRGMYGHVRCHDHVERYGGIRL